MLDTSNVSLTQILKSIRKITEYFEDVVPKKTFPPISNDIVNAAPDWVDKYRLQSTFGTFTDYVLRKMIKEQLSAEIFDESQLIAEISLKHLEKLQQRDQIPPDIMEAALFYLDNQSIVEYYKD